VLSHTDAGRAGKKDAGDARGSQVNFPNSIALTLVLTRRTSSIE
jgi:hypothetical protein